MWNHVESIVPGFAPTGFSIKIKEKIPSPSVNWGRVTLPKWMNFQISSKRPFTLPPLIFRKSCCNFFRKTSEKNLLKGPNSAKYIFGLKMTPAPLWNFSENSSVFVACPVPNPDVSSSFEAISGCEWIGVSYARVSVQTVFFRYISN